MKCGRLYSNATLPNMKTNQKCEIFIDINFIEYQYQYENKWTCKYYVYLYLSY